MPDVHGAGGGTPPGVQVKRLSLFHVIQDQMQVPVREEDPSPEEMVRWAASHLLEAGDQRRVDLGGAEAL